MSLLTITANPSLDRLMLVPGFGTNGVFRETHRLLHAGGKGINVARAARLLGLDARCSGFIGGMDGQRLAALVADEGIPAHWTEIVGETRTCTIIVNPATRENAVVNERGPQVTAADWGRLGVDVLAQAGDSPVCFAGSVPPGTPELAFTELMRSLLAARRPVWVDASGQLLRDAVHFPGITLKVNHEEFAELLGCDLDRPQDLLGVLDSVRALTGGLVVVTFGAAGAVWIDRDRCVLATPPPVEALCAVGSGDSFLAALIVSVLAGMSAEDCLTSACAAGAANALTLGPASFALADYDGIRANVCVDVLWFL